MFVLSIGSIGNHPLIFLLPHLDPIIEIAEEDHLCVEILAEEGVEDTGYGGVALLGFLLLGGEVAVDQLERLAKY